MAGIRVFIFVDPDRFLERRGEPRVESSCMCELCSCRIQFKGRIAKMEHRTKAGMTLAEVIKKAMNDLEISNAEFEEIMNLASADGHIDPSEQRMLGELQSMISSGIVKRVK